MNKWQKSVMTSWNSSLAPLQKGKEDLLKNLNKQMKWMNDLELKYIYYQFQAKIMMSKWAITSSNAGITFNLQEYSIKSQRISFC